jgi:hypothetical protein
MAFQRGDDSDAAKVGAILLADGLDCLRALRALAHGLAGKRR